ncbi:hypothetical protein H4R18_004641 [Coemansia javaensis]|uniref:Fe2OG dioxygenase domain-containing protein n=1 Tax=Coemansia javaensis TaxID=2761396 RepID=A0A9W8HA65_9FUNG|nr:hypothetical protein H4R18_004641 [Coemansia javaensis]
MDDEELDLFGDVTPEEQAAADALYQQRLDAGQAAPAKGRLAQQRRRYLQSGRGPAAFETLRNARPMNFGEVFAAAERQAIIASVHEYVRANQWTTQRHGAFPTRDVPVVATSVADMVAGRLAAALFPRLQEHTGIDARYWTFRDLFVVGYHQDHQRSLDLHSDGCLASLTLLLNDPAEFDGGGTFFAQFGLVVCQTPGDAWIHDSRLEHAGVEITRGQRLVLVAFIDTVSRDPVVALAHRQPAVAAAH